jgi:hypothetical protein|tara:strand:+ start:1610 stop:1822 length:213 start_codon:yes stop_codon:yes gene_type:complete
MPEGLDFTDPKSIRKWGIKLANSCGGAEVRPAGPLMHKPNPLLANALLEQFAQAYNKQLIEGEVDAEEEE